MKRLAFRMNLFPGMEDEYKRRHDAIWLELVGLLREKGISDYSIFLDERTGHLFGVLCVTDSLRLNELPEQPVMQKWWTHMKDIMETHADHSPVSIPLQEVFYMP
jgi:L-rhamnose mutarotase